MSNRTVTTALKAEFGEDAGVATTSCTLCHNTASGGPENVNSTFGNDFAERSVRGMGGGLTITELQETFVAMQALDSDGDGVDNETEFTQCSNPHDPDDLTPSDNCVIPVNTDDGGGCGLIDPSQNSGGGGLNPLIFLMLALPMALLLTLKQGKKTAPSRS